MKQQKFSILFQDEEPALATQYADELRNGILDKSSDIEVNVEQEDPTNLDFGASLVLILGAPAVVALAKALGDWLRLRNSAKIRIISDNGDVIVENVTSDNIDSIIKAVTKMFDE